MALRPAREAAAIAVLGLRPDKNIRFTLLLFALAEERARLKNVLIGSGITPGLAHRVTQSRTDSDRYPGNHNSRNPSHSRGVSGRSITQCMTPTQR